MKLEKIRGSLHPISFKLSEKANEESFFMAASAALTQLLFLPRAIPAPLRTSSFGFTPPPKTHLRFAALGSDLLGDFGARDPFPEEIASNFGEKVIGYSDTEHKILVPAISALSLAERTCETILPTQPPFSRSDAEQLLRKIVGWKLVEEEGVLRIQGVWKLKDERCAEELVGRILAVTEPLGHGLTVRVDPPNQVVAELWTDSIGGLSMNDFIVASKIDNINTKDLLPRKRVWA